jgi:N-acetylglucosamine malate deacetylase 2
LTLPGLVVVAHPDDESVGAGAQLPRMTQARFVYVTDGAPRDGRDAGRHGLSPPQYAQVRRRELETALAKCGIAPGQAIHLDLPDQEAAMRMAPLAHTLADLFTQLGARSVLTHPYEGGHPDHDATAFAVHAAAALRRWPGAAAPEVMEMAGYHLDGDGVRAGCFLPPAGDAVHTVQLTPEQQAHKRALLACFATQAQTLQLFPLDVERFRPAPPYDFLQPPHAGELFYERHALGMTGAQFRAHARAALAELDLRGLL